MNYTNKKKQQSWRKWLKVNRIKLLSTGVPIEVFESESRWWYFLEHEYDVPTKWSVDNLSEREMLILKEFLDEVYLENEANGLIRILNRKLALAGFEENVRVRVRTFNGSLEPDEEVHPSENFWRLIEMSGTIVKDPTQNSIFAAFSDEDRVCVRFDESISKMGLVCHNRIPNALWLAITDLELCR